MNSKFIPFLEYVVVANFIHIIFIQCPLTACIKVFNLVKCEYYGWNNLLQRERISLLSQDISAKAAVDACHKTLL
jgi:hypothetical protein